MNHYHKMTQTITMYQPILTSAEIQPLRY